MPTTKQKPTEALALAIPQAADLKPLLDDKTQAIITRKERGLSEVAQAEEALKRRKIKLEQEIRRLAGAQLEELRQTQKLMKAVKNRRAEISVSIYNTMEDSLTFVPGNDLIEKKQYLIAQRNSEAV